MISAVIITLNEARNLRRCLHSLEGVAAEILILDAGSTDETEQISREFGAQFHVRPWAGYAAAKNFANQLASQFYILSIDADEALSDELRGAILAAKDQLQGAYRMNRLTFYGAHPVRHGGWYPDTKIRLFPKGQAHWEGDFVHERLVVEPSLAVHPLQGDLLHYSFQDRADHRQRIERYSQLAAQRQLAEGKKPSYLKQFFSPVVRFLRTYVLQSGWQDGKTGWDIATGTARAGYLRQQHLRRVIPGKRQILMVNLSKSWGGGEQWFFTVGQALQERGWEVHWLCYPGSTLAQRLRDHHLPYTALPLRFLRLPFQYRSLAHTLRALQPAIVLLNASHELKTVGLVARRLRVPKVIFRRGVSYALKQNVLNRWFMRQVPTHFLANSQATREANFQAFPSLRSLPHLTLNNGIDPAPWPVNRTHRVPHRLGMSARLSAEKGIERAVEAVARLVERGIAVELHIFGEGPERERLQNLIAAQGLEAQIQLRGFVKELAEELNQCSVFVFTPSHGEGTSLALIEAMLLELPCVVMDTPAMAEVVLHGETGFVVPDGEIDALADSLQQLLTQPELSQKMGRQGRERALNFFTLDHLADQLSEWLATDHPK